MPLSFNPFATRASGVPSGTLSHSPESVIDIGESRALQNRIEVVTETIANPAKSAAKKTCLSGLDTLTHFKYSRARCGDEPMVLDPKRRVERMTGVLAGRQREKSTVGAA